MRKSLDGFYNLLLALAAACLLLILVLVGAQVLGRIFDWMLQFAGRDAYGFLVPSLAEIGGYLFAAASFLALAPTLKRGAHIRVTMLLAAFGPGLRRVFELWALAASFAIAAYAAWALGTLTYFSFKFGEVSSGLLPIYYWVPQSAMTLGLVGLCIALADEFLVTLRSGVPTFLQSEAAITMGQE